MVTAHDGRSSFDYTTISMFADSLPESVIKRLTIRARELGAVNLGQGIPSFPTPPHILEAAKAALEDPAIGVYPNFLGELELREAVAKRHGVDVSAVLVTVGAMEATATAILSLVENGDRVGVVTPDYCNHFPQVMLARGEAVPIPLKEADRWTLDLLRIEAEAKKGIKLLLLTNPGNPTGYVASREELKALVTLSANHGFWIIADETYSYLTYGAPFVSLLDFWNESDRAITVRSFSKEYAMTGWRVGYMVARPETIGALAKVHDSLVGCVPKISQRAALAAVTGPQDFVMNNQKAYERRRAMTVEAIGEIPGLSLPTISGAYYAFPKYTGNRPSERVAEDLLTKAGVAVVAGEHFGNGGQGHVRLLFAVDDAVLSEGLSRLRRYFVTMM